METGGAEGAVERGRQTTPAAAAPRHPHHMSLASPFMSTPAQIADSPSAVTTRMATTLRTESSGAEARCLPPGSTPRRRPRRRRWAPRGRDFAPPRSSPRECARGDRHRPRRRVARHGSHPAEVDEDRAVAHAQLGVPSAAQREGHAVARPGTRPPSLPRPETALDPRGDEANRQHGRSRARAGAPPRPPSLVEARVPSRPRRAGTRRIRACLGGERRPRG